MASQSFLNKAYLSYFGRPMDPSGAIAFANASEADVQAAFFASPESKSLYGSTFNDAQVNAFYQMLFNRDAEPAGLAYWTNQVAIGALTPTGAAMAILAGAQNSDVTTVANKLDASLLFFNNLDTTAEFLAYHGNTAALTARNFLKTVTTTPATIDQINAAIVGISTNNPTLAYSATTFAESTANNGAITTTSTITLTGDTFTGAVGSALGLVINVPAGLTAVLVKASDTTATLSFTGTATAHANANDVSNLTVKFSNSDFTGNIAAVVSGSTKSDLIIDFISATLTYSATTFAEAAANNGSITTTSTITLANDTFAGAVGAALGTVSNVPVGLTAVLVKASDTTATLSFTGNATAHANANDISNLTVTFSDADFASGLASAVLGATKSDLVIDFSDTDSGTFTLTEASPTITLAGTSTDAFVMALGGGATTRAALAVTPSSGTLQASDVNFTGTAYSGNETITTTAAADVVKLGNGTNIVNIVSGGRLGLTSTGGTGIDTFNFVLAADLANSTVNGNSGTDVVKVTTVATTSLTLVDASFATTTSVESLVLKASGAGGNLSFTSGANINTMAGANSLSVNATTDAGTLTIAENSYVTAGSLTTTSTTGNQTITIGTGGGTAVQTVTANSTSGTIGITVGNGADTINATSTLAAGNISITGGSGGDTINATTASTAAQIITGGSGVDTITSVSVGGTISVAGKGGADIINLGTHAGAATIVYDAANQGGATLAATTATALAVGDVIAGTAGFKTTTDFINVTAFTVGTHAAATSTINNWNMTNNTVFVLTGATVAVGATAATVSGLIGTVTAVDGATNIGIAAIAVTGVANTWNLYEVDIGAGSTHGPGTALGAADTISLVGTVTANGALTPAMFTA